MAVGEPPAAIGHFERLSQDGGDVHDTRAQDETGASAVEYGLLVAGIATIITIAVYAFGLAAAEITHTNCTQITSATGTTISASCG